jgi:acyl-CoA synthetase (AMP-forming)/AMP-acid ligase II
MAFQLDTLPLAWATHRLGGIQSPANAQYSVSEVAYQLKDSGASCVFTCLPLLQSTIEAAAKVGIPHNRIYLLELPTVLTGDAKNDGFITVSDLITRGKKLPPLEPLKWSKGEGERRTAFLCYSSGTSGLPVGPSYSRLTGSKNTQKGVMISHRNVIANVMQITAFDGPFRDTLRDPMQKHYMENVLTLLPMSHIYALVVMCHTGPYRGDGNIVLPRFEMQMLLGSIQKHKINTLYLVPPIIIMMTKNKPILDKFDLRSVRILFTGAAPLGKETADDIAKQYPRWLIRQGYGLTETSTVVSSTSGLDIWFGSSGSLISGIEARIVDTNGKEVTAYDTPGEMWVKSPAVTLGYLHNEKATNETYVTDAGGRWMRTGDEVVVRKAPSGNEHFFIVDRIKELIKVKVWNCHCSQMCLTLSGPPSRSRRAGGSSPDAPLRRRLRRHRCAR